MTQGHVVPRLLIPYIWKREEIFKDLFLLFLQAPGRSFLSQQPICKCLFSFFMFCVNPASREWQAFSLMPSPGLFPLVPWEGAAKYGWGLFLFLQ